MGDIADAMLEGDLCEGCGVYMPGGAGFPQRCSDCSRGGSDFPRVHTAKVKCPTCKKTVKAVGLSDHMRDAHKSTGGKP